MSSIAHRLVVLVAIASLVGIAACPKSAPQPRPPDDRPTVACRRGDTTNDLPMNDLPMNDLPMNGMSTASLNDNKPLLDAIETIALTEDLFMTPDHAALLGAEHGVELMKYVAACALDPCDDIIAPKTLSATALATLPRRGNDPVFAGELGLCGRTSEAPWRTGAPDVACLRRVSSCMLARTNAMRAKVRLSLRGDRTHLVAAVPIATQFREEHGTPIRSLQSCTATRDANCGWTPQYVGRCAGVGTSTVIEARSSTGHPLELRVCSGTYGCDDPKGPMTEIWSRIGDDLQPIPPVSVSNPPFYAGSVLASGTASVELTCPDNGPIDQVKTGYYAVMVRATDGSAVAPDEVEVTATPATRTPYDAYPASEADVFVFQEGAFFGDLFEDPPATSASLQFACASDVWSDAKAMMSYRLCAGPVPQLPAGCFGNLPEACSETCNSKTVDGHSVMDVCAASREWTHPYTTYLDHPCALIPTAKACSRLLTDSRLVARLRPHL